MSTAMATDVDQRTLEHWHNWLQAHFARLRSERAVGWPIFALEHGLTVEDLTEISALVRAYTDKYFVSSSAAAWLPFVICATELGYRYDGEEYWTTFLRAFPNWQSSERYQLREMFERFHKEFGGAKPSGTWADHFSIICWPITHAVLPTDLQKLLAKTLYEIRHQFTFDVLHSVETLGRLIQRKAESERSSRFRDFAQEPLLSGQIASALLFEGRDFVGTLLSLSTLRRVLGDLDQTQASRLWLQQARKSASRVELKGIHRTSQLTPGPLKTAQQLKDTQEKQSASREVRELAIEPRLTLRPVGKKDWEVWLQLPDFGPLVKKHADLRELLETSRPRVFGSSGRPLTPGRLLGYVPSARARIVATAQRSPNRRVDGTATWSLSTLQRKLRRGGFPTVGTSTIRRVLLDAGSSYQRTRTWCPTGTAQRKRKAGVVTVVDPRTEEKRGSSNVRTASLKA